MKLPISVIILTFNEEINLARCLNSVDKWADEIIIVDSYSIDKTLEIAKKYGAKVVQHKFENQAQQFNWALDNVDIKNDWIFRLDADEWLTEELKEEITEVLQHKSAAINGFYIKRRVYFMGRWIRHGGYYPTWILRFFRKGKARSEEREMDEHIVLLEGRTGKLKYDFIDDNQKDLEWWTNKHNNFSTREVEAVLRERDAKYLKGQAGQKRWIKERVYLKLPMFCRAFFYFIYRYFIRLGFLDGKEGLIFHFLQGFWYRFLIDAKLYEVKKENKRSK